MIAMYLIPVSYLSNVIYLYLNLYLMNIKKKKKKI